MGIHKKVPGILETPIRDLESQDGYSYAVVATYWDQTEEIFTDGTEALKFVKMNVMNAWNISLYNPYIMHYSSFHFLFHYPNIAPL